MPSSAAPSATPTGRPSTAPSSSPTASPIPTSSPAPTAPPAGTITEFGGSLSEPAGITAGPDGNLWFTELGGGADTTGKIGRITTSGVITQFGGSLSAPVQITTGPDGNLWFTEESINGKIGRITTAGVITEFGGSLSAPTGITTGPDGNLWFTEAGINSMGGLPRPARSPNSARCRTRLGSRLAPTAISGSAKPVTEKSAGSYRKAYSLPRSIFAGPSRCAVFSTSPVLRTSVDSCVVRSSTCATSAPFASC